jgi:Ser/Thr protein kinase RdoA (MazF antagonist)
MWRKEILHEACSRYGGTISSLKLVGGFYKNVYEYERDGETCILKLIPFATKDRNLLYSELKWITYLRKKGIQIPNVVLSARGNTIEVIRKLPVPCCVISFKKAEGTFVEENLEEYWNTQLFTRWGQTMGKLHSLAKQFEKENKHTPFEEWNEGEIFYRDLSSADQRILDIWHKTLEKIRNFPRTDETYGIIHNSFHHRNFLVSPQGELILFNFNHCKYHWFTYDIAIALYHALEIVPPIQRRDFVKDFLNAFAEGYTKEYPLPEEWQEQVFFFVMYRNLFLYLYELIYRQEEDLTEEQKAKLEEEKEKLLIGDYVRYWKRLLSL